MQITPSSSDEKPVSLCKKIAKDFAEISELTKQLARDDPRRVIHSLKVGLAITIVSLFYYFDPLYQGFGVNAMWAVLTVVVVFEFSVGATLGKGVNRAMATVFGAMAGFGVHRLSTLSGEKLEPFLMGLLVFIIVAVSTYTRFYPKMKARFDYGILIFILTFCLICVSGYRDDEVLDMAHRRITTILIGSSTAVLVCVIIWPVWAGNDLHKLVASNIDKLGDFFQGFGAEFFKSGLEETMKDNNKVSLNGFRSILDSRNNIDSLVTFAKWEPRHGRFKSWHPWTQYQKIGELTRHCACTAEALYGYLHSQIQAPAKVKAKFQEPCIKMSTESGKALKEMAMTIKKMTQPSKANRHIQMAQEAAQYLDDMLKSSTSWDNLSLSEVTPAATVASLLADVVGCIEEIEVAVQEFATLARFKNVVDRNEVSPQIERCKTLGNQGSIKRRSFANHVITIEGSSPSVSEFPSSLSMGHQGATE